MNTIKQVGHRSGVVVAAVGFAAAAVVFAQATASAMIYVGEMLMR